MVHITSRRQGLLVQPRRPVHQTPVGDGSGTEQAGSSAANRPAGTATSTVVHCTPPGLAGRMDPPRGHKKPTGGAEPRWVRARGTPRGRSRHARPPHERHRSHPSARLLGTTTVARRFAVHLPTHCVSGPRPASPTRLRLAPCSVYPRSGVAATVSRPRQPPYHGFYRD